MVPKDEVINLRVDETVKKRLQDAATAKGKSLTTFIVEASLKAATVALDAEAIWASLGLKGKRRPSARFESLCEEARRGGRNGWRKIGFHLAAAVGEDQLYDQIEESKMKELRSAFEKNDRKAVWDWYTDQLPRHLYHVPRKRQEEFVDGLFAAYENGSF